MKRSARPALESLEERLTPSGGWYGSLPKGDQEALKSRLREVARAGVVRPAPLAAVALPAVPAVRLNSPPAHPPVVAPPQMTHAAGPAEMEAALLTFDPSIALSMSAYQVKKLDDQFAEAERKGARDPRSGRFVGLVAREPAATPAAKTKVKTVKTPPRPRKAWSPKSDQPMPRWVVGGLIIEAPTASEARARWKERTGQPRVPRGVKAVRLADPIVTSERG